MGVTGYGSGRGINYETREKREEVSHKKAQREKLNHPAFALPSSLRATTWHASRATADRHSQKTGTSFSSAKPTRRKVFLLSVFRQAKA